MSKLARTTSTDGIQPLWQDVVAIARRAGATFDVAAACYRYSVLLEDHESADRARYICEELTAILEPLPATEEGTTLPLATRVDDRHPLWDVLEGIVQDLMALWDRADAADKQGDQQAATIRDMLYWVE